MLSLAMRVCADTFFAPISMRSMLLGFAVSNFSAPGEIPFENYIRIDTSELSADETAERIISAFSIPLTCQTGKE